MCFLFFGAEGEKLHVNTVPKNMQPTNNRVVAMHSGVHWDKQILKLYANYI